MLRWTPQLGQLLRLIAWPNVALDITYQKASKLADDVDAAFDNRLFSVWINDHFVFKPSSLLYSYIPTGSIVWVKSTIKDTLPWSLSTKFECVKITDQHKMDVQKPFVVISACATRKHYSGALDKQPVQFHSCLVN